MADEQSGEDAPITFHIKTAGDAKYTVNVPLTMLVSSLKDLLSAEQYANLPAARQRLIYSGRVLKDGDTLATYKIKEGHTLHMVKTADSNARNQPGAANTAGVSSSSTSSGNNPSAGQTPSVPTMAAGTGANNLLAGLTGARFAGLAQLPNQSMFGPDGGMGAPPDPEEAMRQLENPEARRQLNEALSNPAILDEIIRSNPMLSNMPGAREMLQSPMMREMMTNPDLMRQSMRFRQAMGGAGAGFGAPTAGGFQAPGGVEGGEGAAAGTAAGGATGTGQQQAGQPAANPFAAFFGGGPGAGAGAGAGLGADNPFLSLVNQGMFGAALGQAGAAATDGNREGGSDATSPPSNPFGNNPFANPMTQTIMRNLMANPELMNQMTQGMWGQQPSSTTTGNTAPGQEGERTGTDQQQPPANPFAALFGGGAGGAPGANPFAAFGDMGGFGGPPDNRPPEERFADQLRQLNDMGFYDFDRNIEALRRSGGSVQGAVNYLLGA